MSQATFSKADLVKRINYHNLFQEVAGALPAIMMENANSLSEQETKVITELRGNVIAISIAVVHSIKKLYKAIPDYSEMRNLSPSSYSEFLYNALQGLIAIDGRLLKPPLQRLFGDSILINEAINEKHPMFAYVKLCGPEFIAESKRTMASHFEEALKERFLSFQPFKNKPKASYPQRQLTFFPIVKSSSEPINNAKWQLYYMSTSHYGIAVDCTAEKSDDRFKVYYEDVNQLIETATISASNAKKELRFRLKRHADELPLQKLNEAECKAVLQAKFKFKGVQVRGVDPGLVLSYKNAFSHILKRLGGLAELVNEHTTICFTALRKSSVYDRKANMMVISVDPNFHDCKLGYLYGQAIDNLIAVKLLEKPNHLGSDYWYRIKGDESVFTAIINMYKCLTYQRSPNFVYCAALLDGLCGKYFFLHPAELFARAVIKYLAVGATVNELKAPTEGVAGLLYPNREETDVFSIAVDGLITTLPATYQNVLEV